MLVETLSGPERTMPYPPRTPGDSGEAQVYFSRLQASSPPHPQITLLGTPSIWLPVMPSMQVAYPKDTGSTRKVCPRHLHNPRKVTGNWRNQDSVPDLRARLLHSPRAHLSRNHKQEAQPHGLGKPVPASAIWGNPRHQKAVSLAVDRGELQCSPVQMTRAQFLDQQGWAQLHETDRQTDRQARAE